MIYDIGFFIFSLIYLPTLIFKGKLHSDFGERFCRYDPVKRAQLASARDVIWVQAVSVGEVALCRTLMPILKRRFPGSTIVMSTITKTGNDLAKKLFARDAIIIYFPLDFSMVVRKAVSMIRPMAYVMIETEIWPNVLKELARRSVPAILINGRISDRSFGKYMEVRTFLKKTLGRVRAYCMQSQLDADRIIAMGAPKDRVTVTGNMKFDVSASSVARSAAEILQSLGLSEQDKLFVAGSTHPGEEASVLEAFRSLKGLFPELALLIAPRHIERAGDVAWEARACNFDPVLLSRCAGQPPAKTPGRVLILDSIGKLGEIYSVASLVFIGGSLVKHGGQNPIEPALFEKPVFFGPYMFNFKSASTLLLERRGAVQVTDRTDLLQKAMRLLRDPDERVRLGNNAKAAIMENRGASERNVAAIAKLISNP